MNGFVNNFSIKVKIYLITVFAIIYLILSLGGNSFVIKNIEDTFTKMNQTTLENKDRVNSLIKKINNLNKLVVVASISEEYTEETAKKAAEINDLVRGDLRILEKLSANRDKKEIIELLKKINLRYDSFYNIAIKLNKAFAKDFDDGIDAIIGLDAISSKMFKELNSLEHLSEKEFKNSSNQLYELMKFSKNVSIIASIVVIIIFVAFAAMITSSITKSITNFQSGLVDFFNYLNKKSLKAKLIKHRFNDEVGSMAEIVDENIINIEKNIENDKLVLEDVSSAVDRITRGDLSVKLKAQTDNPTLRELMGVLNEMIKSLHDIVEHSLDTLKQYESQDFTVKTTIKCTGQLCELMNGIDNLGGAISKMLTENKKSGLILQESSNQLLEDVNILNKNTTNSAASLEETAASVEDVTSNIASSTEYIAQMSNYANDVTASVNAGSDLAAQTTKAMDDINEEVNSINEAITVIDQIAFQTNILSLNAAVEAATAGESGKGFAVVAQEVRNLAARSAEAANEIKSLVENATDKANSGKSIADKMISGYGSLNESINKTIDLIKVVESSSSEQYSSIQQINDAIVTLDRQTQQNADIASQTTTAATKTAQIASKLVEDAESKKFTEI